MSYMKGKDIKVPFDCLWHCYTRSFKVTSVSWSDKCSEQWEGLDKPEDFEKW